MSAHELLQRLDAIGVSLKLNADRLSVVGDQRVLADRELMASLKTHRSDLIDLLQQRAGNDAGGIPPEATTITPDMVPLAALEQGDIDRIVAATQGGASAIQDIYPLTPLQEGILFHHRLHGEADAYVLPTLLRLDSRERLDAFVAALNEVIARHDILRSCVHWDDLPQPQQVVWREARLQLEELARDPAFDSAQAQLTALADPRRLRLDVRRAPLLRALALPEGEGRWLLQLLHHHLVLDHTASELLLQEVMQILAGRHAELPPPLPFRPFVAQARRTSGEAHEAFFRRELGDVEEPTAPLGLLDVQGDGSALERAVATLDTGLARRLRHQVRSRGLSPASLFHLAWAKVLALFCGREDVVFGTVLFGRLQGGAATARALGMFLNTLPLRLRLDEHSVEQALRQAQAGLVALLAHEHAPLALAQRCSAVPANLPLFTSLLNYRHSHADADAPRLDGIEHLGGHDRTNYPLVIHVDDFGEGFGITAETLHGAGAARLVQFLLQAVRVLVQALESAPQQALDGLEVMPAAERLRVLHVFNDTATAYPQGLLHELFEQQVRRTPDAIALRSEALSLSYEQLNRRANRLARALREKGAGPDARVAVLLQRGLDLVVALLAILKSGAAYVPLDPVHPDERLRQMLDDSAPVAVLSDAALAPRLAASLPLLLLAGGGEDWPQDEADLPAREIGLNDTHLAYLIYTSGSTGRPKGVMNEHRGIVNRLHWMQQAYTLGADDVVLQKTPFGFDVSVWEFFWPLMVGAQLVLARPDGHRDPVYLGELIRERGVTTLHFVPSMLQVFLASTEAVAGCASVRHVVCSGEALPTALAQQCLAALPRSGLHNLYGPTEAAVDVSAWSCSAQDDIGSGVPIGRPIANTRLYVLDARLRPVPIGVSGEIYIGGVQVARGYLNKPTLTQERFIADPYWPGQRLYRSGDLGRWREDGAIDYLGRNDFQVKIRGFRIEPGEIEAQLKRQPGVAEAAVIAREDVPGDKRLVAYVTPRRGAVIDTAALRQALQAQLPDYMVPAAFVALAALPLSTNGKLDRAALPAPDSAGLPRDAFEPPLGEAEELLAALWSELLRQPRIGRRDDFFRLGGHSLLAVQLLERLRQLGWQLDIRALFAQPGLIAMAAALTPAAAAVAVPANGLALRPVAAQDNEETEEYRL